MSWDVPVCTIRPWRMIEMRSPSRSASSRSWLTNRMVFFTRACSASSSSCSLSRISGSSAENGSSISRMSALVAKARARPTRCCMPPESSPTSRSAHCARPTSSSCSATTRRRSSGAIPRSSRPSPTLSATLRHGSRPNCWNTIATRSRRMRRRSSAPQRATSIGPPPSAINTWPRVTGFRRFAARSRVDLPDPESPIITQISPGAMARLAPATPTMTPSSAASSSRLAPASRRASAACTARSPRRPRSRGNRMSMSRNSSAALIRSARGPAG